MTMMRAKMRVKSVNKHEGCEELAFSAVSKNDGYPADGSDENNTFAKWTPSAHLEMSITSPALFGKINEGEEYYLDFTKAS
jgi:hypothetical protein